MNKGSLIKRHPVKTIALLLLLLFAFTEIALRILFALKSYPVGTMAPSWLAFEPVDSLEVWDSYYMDGNGIYKAGREYWNRQPQPNWNINSEGFRGREFIADTLNDSAATILFIGDSYTWGAHATPPDSCFVDLLDDGHSFVCYNAGIPGTDPAQYLQVAKVYMPRVKPQFTLVILYLGNDLMDSVRPIIPYENIYYQTTAGWLTVNYKGLHFDSAKESYKYVTNKFSPHSLWEKMFLKTAIGTAALTLPLRLEEYRDWNRKKNSSVTNDYLQQIRGICEQNHTTCFIFIIPREADLNEAFYKNPQACIAQRYPALMPGLEDITIVFPFRKEHLYPMPDGHLNNKGHEFAAEFIRKKLMEDQPENP